MCICWHEKYLHFTTIKFSSELTSCTKKCIIANQSTRKCVCNFLSIILQCQKIPLNIQTSFGLLSNHCPLLSPSVFALKVDCTNTDLSDQISMAGCWYWSVSCCVGLCTGRWNYQEREHHGLPHPHHPSGCSFDLVKIGKELMWNKDQGMGYRWVFMRICSHIPLRSNGHFLQGITSLTDMVSPAWVIVRLPVLKALIKDTVPCRLPLGPGLNAVSLPVITENKTERETLK